MRKVDRIWDWRGRGREDGEGEEEEEEGDGRRGTVLLGGGLEEDGFFWGGFDLGICWLVDVGRMSRHPYLLVINFWSFSQAQIVISRVASHYVTTCRERYAYLLDLG